MNQTEKSRASLFLIELIIAILFFSLGSAVCIQAFSKAALLSRSAADLSFASSQVSSAASVIRYSEDPLGDVQEFFPGARAQGEGFCVYYDADRQICSHENAVYTMKVSIRESNGFCRGSITMTGSDDEVIYELETHYPSSVGEENPS